MPKSIFPPKGGPYPPAWRASASRPSQPSGPASDAADRRALENEIERLRAELARLQAYREPGPKQAGKAVPVWAALALCGAAFLFAILAIWFHF